MTSLRDLSKKTLKISRTFGGKEWSKEARLIDLMEEVGELSNAILVKEGYKNKKRAKAELEDSLCDVLYELLILSELYGINLEKEYTDMLKRLEKRIKQKEFQDE